MARLDDLLPNASVRGILPDGLVTVFNVQWYGSEALEFTYKDAKGKVSCPTSAPMGQAEVFS